MIRGTVHARLEAVVRLRVGGVRRMMGCAWSTNKLCGSESRHV